MDWKTKGLIRLFWYTFCMYSHFYFKVLLIGRPLWFYCEIDAHIKVKINDSEGFAGLYADHMGILYSKNIDFLTLKRKIKFSIETFSPAHKILCAYCYELGIYAFSLFRWKKPWISSPLYCQHNGVGNATRIFAQSSRGFRLAIKATAISQFEIIPLFGT